jgi:hypothetical protein
VASNCLSRYGEARWGDARWGEVADLTLIVQGSATPTGVLARTPVINRSGTVTPTGALTLPPEWIPALPPSHPGGYPGSTRSRGTGPMTHTDQVPQSTEEV